MKHLIPAFFLFSFSYTFGQSDTIRNTSEVNAIWKADSIHYPLKKGFYKTYEEFLANAPSLQREFYINLKSSPEKLKQGTYAVSFDLAPGQPKVGKIWGFCDGIAVYAKASRVEAWYWKVEYIGPYSFFIHYHQPRSISDLVLAGTPVARELTFINKKGHGQYVFENTMRELCGKVPGLLEEFDLELKTDEPVRRTYLQKLNEYLAVHPEVLKN